MSASTIFLIFLWAVAALGLALFQYFYRSGGRYRMPWVLTSLRFVTLFSLLLLLINPEIPATRYYIEKPNLVLAVDNSASIQNFGAAAEVTSFVKDVATNPDLQERFEIQVYTFGQELRQEGVFGFDEPQTNIQGGLRSLDQLYKNTNAPTILITDGNQTFGEDYVFAASGYSNPVIPVLVGDTTMYQDLSLDRVNVNRYAYLDNRFPVELMLSYTGDQAVSSRLEIRSKGAVVHAQEISLDKTANSEVVRIHLPASRIGVNTFEAEIKPLEQEKNISNNARKFAVEVIDQRTSILLVTELLHPDLGVIKRAVESNQQRKVEIHHLGSAVPDLEEHQLVIVYQPTAGFGNLMEELQQQEKNYWIITGPETDWRFLNRAQPFFQKELSGQDEEIFPVLNQDYGEFQVDDIGFSGFPPLSGSFGDLDPTQGVESILYQQVQGITTKDPLLATLESGSSTHAFLFGADLWKWRAQVYAATGSFQDFDDLLGKLIQYLASGQRKERLTLDHESFYLGNEGVLISAQYFDKNYQFDPGERLELKLEDQESGETQSQPMLLRGNSYQADLGNLAASGYAFTVSVAGEPVSGSGTFEVLEFNVEQQFDNANLRSLRSLAENKETSLYFLKDSQNLISSLLSENSLAPLQKSRENNVPLVDWYYLLAIIVLSLSMEWFLRKYQGLV